MSSSKLIQNTVTKSLPYFPVISTGKHRRVMSKHFNNLALWLPIEELQLLNFLVYELNADNTFKYDTFLLQRYSTAVKVARMTYGEDVGSLKNLTQTRRCLQRLIERGLLLQTGTKNKIMVNPLLTYNSDIINTKQYKSVMEMYQYTSPEKITVFTDYFGKLVSDFLESKKKNYKYGNRK